MEEEIDAEIRGCYYKLNALYQRKFTLSSCGECREISDKVEDSNPYSRLLALQRMGIVQDYKQIRRKAVAIIGIGGIGSVAAEMLVRCGIGKLIIFDYDVVELANMNRLFFQPYQTGLNKVDAAAVTLNAINPDVLIEAVHCDITINKNYDMFVDKLLRGGICDDKVDLLLCCVDNFEARMTINMTCNEHNLDWFESGVSENAMSGHIQLVCPGKLPCFECLPPLIVATGIDEKTLKREGVCAASLPTTMGIVSSLLIQNALKYLMKFGKISPYIGYSALKDDFYKVKLFPNPECGSVFCMKRQQENGDAGYLHDGGSADNKVEDVIAVHEDNEYGIELMVEENATNKQTSSPAVHLKFGEGISAAYIKSSANDEPTITANDENVSVEDLMEQLKKL